MRRQLREPRPDRFNVDHPGTLRLPLPQENPYPATAAAKPIHLSADKPLAFFGYAIFGYRLEVTHGNGSASAVTDGMKKCRHHWYADGLAPAIKLSTEDSAGINTGSRVKSGAEASA